MEISDLPLRMKDRMPRRRDLEKRLREEWEDVKTIVDPAHNLIRREEKGKYVITPEIYDYNDGVVPAVKYSLRKAFKFWQEDDFPDEVDVYFEEVRSPLFRAVEEVLRKSERHASAYNGNGKVDLDKMPDGWEGLTSGPKVMGGSVGLLSLMTFHPLIALGGGATGGLMAYKGDDIAETAARVYHQKKIMPRNEFYQLLLE